MKEKINTWIKWTYKKVTVITKWSTHSGNNNNSCEGCCNLCHFKEIAYIQVRHISVNNPHQTMSCKSFLSLMTSNSMESGNTGVQGFAFGTWFKSCGSAWSFTWWLSRGQTLEHISVVFTSPKRDLCFLHRRRHCKLVHHQNALPLTMTSRLSTIVYKACMFRVTSNYFPGQFV